mmetsp:Transcript_79068/g.211302  ORF Transcript_79068/g.211302 Transcript_79068/m.211302 type:complete len:80 (+) Transcript_79068:324-563(+)
MPSWTSVWCSPRDPRCPIQCRPILGSRRRAYHPEPGDHRRAEFRPAGGQRPGAAPVTRAKDKAKTAKVAKDIGGFFGKK